LIRPALPLDAGQVGAILSDFIDSTTWMPRMHTRAEEIAFADRLIAQNWVNVFERTGIEAFIARQGSKIHALYVSSPAQGHGIGTRLVNHAKSQNDTLELWTFQKNLRAQQFYTRHGFIEKSRTDGRGNDEKLPDIHLKWQRSKG
jgi:GNAT superfamily N-acetyltransferase